MIEAARDLVAALDLEEAAVFVWGAAHRARIAYRRAPDTPTARADMAVMIEWLVADGWTGDPQFRTHGAALTKNGVHALLRPQNSSVATRNIELIVQRPDV